MLVLLPSATEENPTTSVVVREMLQEQSAESWVNILQSLYLGYMSSEFADETHQRAENTYAFFQLCQFFELLEASTRTERGVVSEQSA